MTNMCSLGSVVDVVAGQPAPKTSELSQEGRPFIRAGSLENLLNGGSLADCERVPESTAQTRKLRLFPEDTIVFAKSGMSATLGRIYRLPEPAYVVSHLAALVPTGRYDPAYLTQWLRTYPPTSLIKDSAYPSIRITEIEGLQVPDISPNEQRRVARVLDKAELVLRKRGETLELANALLRSAFLTLFGHPLDPNGRLTRSELSAYCDFFAGGTLPLGEDYTGQADGLFLIKVSDLNAPGNEFSIRTAKYWLPSKPSRNGGVVAPAGAVVFPKRGGAIATNKKRVLERDSILDPNLMAVAAKSDSRISTEYMRTWFELIDLADISSGSSVPQLNKRDLAPLPFGVPDPDDVERFTALTSRIGRMRERIRTQIGDADLLCRSLASRAFRGEL